METECRLLAARGGEEVGVESMLLLGVEPRMVDQNPIEVVV